MSAEAGRGRAGRVEGWSRAPLAGRLPAVLLVALVGLAAVVRPVAPLVFVGLLFLYLLSRQFGARSASLASIAGAAAALLPAAAILVWRSLEQPAAAANALDCANVVSPPAVWRFLEAAVGLTVLLVLVRERRGSLAELGFRRGSRRVRFAAIAALVVIGPIALYAATVMGSTPAGSSFFGAYRLDTSQLAALVPALLFAGSNALAEELAYRGAMRVWLVPALGVMGANVAQAVVFGLAHTGDDFAGAEAGIATMLAMVVVGFIGGIIARRTGSLTLVLAIHAAVNIPMYFYWACRIG